MRDKIFGKMIKEIYKENKAPENLDRIILNYINRKKYIRNMTISIAASFIFLLTIIMFFERNLEITKNIERKVERKVEIVKKEKGVEKKIVKESENIRKEEKREFYLVFPQEDDILEETGNIVFYVEGDIKEIRYEIDGEIYTLNVTKSGTILIPASLDEGMHNLRIIIPEEKEIFFYSAGEV
jgi:hypothetical protein